MRIAQIPFKLIEKPYYFTDVDKFLSASIKPDAYTGNNKGNYIYNIACAFDIETSSFYMDDDRIVDYKEKRNILDTVDENYNPCKVAIMYIWQFGINGRVIYGRSWLSLLKVLDKVIEYLHIDLKHRLIIYIHNFAFEFQFIRRWFKWHKVFATDTREPLYAITETGLEFRCSLMLSGYSLDNLAKNLLKYNVTKLVGDLDYSLIRNSSTILSDSELQYCINDVLVVMAYIQEKIEEYTSLFKLPLTNTGFVREFCRNRTIYIEGTHKRNKYYYNMIHDLNITNADEFKVLQEAFAGGFTHCNAKYNNVVVNDVVSYDFTSSYPYVMLSERYPMSTAVKVKIDSKEQFYKIVNSKHFVSIFEITFNQLFTKIPYENYLSFSKCIIDNVQTCKNGVVNNGRIVCCDECTTGITSVDFKILEECYTWHDFNVKEMYVYKADYLPVPFLKCILTLYKDKTELKGVKGREIDYLRSKGMLNACYGMCVTSPIRDDIDYTNELEWKENAIENVNDALQKHNDNKRRFLFYPWGVFVTAYARYNLFTGILSVGDDYIYSDTDSLKLKNADLHIDYFNDYNNKVIAKLKMVADRSGINVNDFAPKTIKGTVKQLGIWDLDCKYDSFKTLGAKRYMYSCANAFNEYPISITVSGVNKSKAIPYLWNKSGCNINTAFDMFVDGLKVPADDTGKNIHSYIDDIARGKITDYNGITDEFLELSAVHLEPTEYNMSLVDIYIKYCMKIKTISY